MRKTFKHFLVVLISIAMVSGLLACTPVAPETKITLSATTLALEVGQDADLTATITPEDLEISWASSDESIAKYENGKVYAQNSVCPDGVCEHSLPITKSGDSIICLPNKIMIKISGEGETDAISG